MSTIEVPTEVPVAEAEKPREELFRWNAWLHVGEGADECEHKQDGICTDERHFHAWCRLPNPFQVRDIADKARAAQARYRKFLRTEDSDERVMLEDELESLRERPREILVDEALDRDFADDYDAAVREVADIEDPEWVSTGEEGEEPGKLYAHIDQDREEYNRQRLLPEEQRDPDFAALEKSVAAYGKAVEKAMRAVQEPRRQAYTDMPLDELIERIRRERIEQKSTEVYLHHYNTWQWYVCTFKPKKKGTPDERVFSDLTQMKLNTPPEVIYGLKSTFEALEGNMVADRRGKGS